MEAEREATSIRAGAVRDIRPESGEWVFVDIGFSSTSKSCGVLRGTGSPVTLTFAQLAETLVGIASAPSEPLNLLIEAPLSVAFNNKGNPTGRSVERFDTQTRYWYVGLGCGVLVAATHLLRQLHDHASRRPIRLFEGFVSFKVRTARSRHQDDVTALREVVWHPERHHGAIIPPDALQMRPTDSLRSAFAVAGMDFGIPPVIVAAVAQR